jgi:uncharacterized membrane protein
MSRTGSVTTKNKKNQKMRDWGFELTIIILVTELVGILAEIILSLLNISPSSRLANFVVFVVMFVAFISTLMYFIGRHQEACQEQVVEK